MSHNHYFVHEFRVVMVVDDIDNSGDAHSWIDARLNGGDAIFFSTVLSAPEMLTIEEARTFSETANLPTRFEQAATCTRARTPALDMTTAYNLAEIEQLIVDGRYHATERPADINWMRRTILAMAAQLEAARDGLLAFSAQVAQTDPQCPIGTALSFVGLTRSPGSEPMYDQLLRSDLDTAIPAQAVAETRANNLDAHDCADPANSGAAMNESRHDHSGAIERDVRLGRTSREIRDEIIRLECAMADARTPEMQARYDAAVARERDLLVDDSSLFLTLEQVAVLARCFRIGLGELQTRVARGDEDAHLTKMIDTFEAYFAVCRAELGHDRVPITIWETYTAIKRRNGGSFHG